MDKVEGLRKKERHEDIEKGRVLSKRSINQVDDRQPISKLGTQLSV
jgi:hypothetical protein